MKRLAYLVLAHDDPVHFGRLVNALGSDVYVHLDAKSDMAPFHDVAPSFVRFVDERRSVAWAGISMVDALMALIETALEHKHEYTHFVFLTGADYPIKSAQEINDCLINRPGHEFIRYIDMRDSPEHYMKLIGRKHFLEPIIPVRGKYSRFLDKVVRKLMTSLRLPNHWRSDVIPYFGHTWCALTPECCEYVLTFHRENRWFYEMNRRTMAVDEHYFHTIVGNSPFGRRADGLQEYQGRGLWRLVNLHLICPTLQKWFSLEDWDSVASSEKLFVRKVNSRTGADLINRIDRELRINRKEIA